MMLHILQAALKSMKERLLETHKQAEEELNAVKKVIAQPLPPTTPAQNQNQSQPATVCIP
jgi:hypothetical protein